MTHAFAWRKMQAGFLGILVLATVLLIVQPTAARNDCGDGGLIAQRYAHIHFNRTINTTLGLNATIWFQYQVNDSKVWAYDGILAWAFDPNLSFWAFVHGDLARITATVAPGRSVEPIQWGTPFRRSLDHIIPDGLVIDYNNGTYSHSGSFAKYYPYTGPELAGSFTVRNYTLIVRSALLLPPEHWIAEFWWDTEGLSDTQWTDLAESLSTQLNATWYIESCVFDKVPYDCGDNGVSWPFEVVFVGLLVLVGLGTKGRHRSRRKPFYLLYSNQKGCLLGQSLL